MKTLIYYYEEDLKPVGGPCGYLFNLKKELDKNGVDNVYFLKKGIRKEGIIKKLRNWYIKKVPQDIQVKLGLYEFVMRRKVFGKRNRKAPINLNDYDIVHFHSAISMYMAKDSLKDYNGKVILTSHTPKVSYKEILDGMISEKKYKKNPKKYDRFEIIDEYAFNRADYIIFPTKDSEECYYNTWDKYSAIHEKNKDKYIYIPSGIIDVKVFEDKNSIRKKYNIPNNAFVISYVGRHNEIKGYSQLKKIGEKILNDNENVYFLIGGKEDPLKGLKNEKWIEIGWTNKPHDLINASDLFILPNKETYFDLIMLEVLSVGKSMLVTNTGGNKYFKKFNKNGIFYYDYDSIEEAKNKIIEIMKLDTFSLDKKNKELFKKNFTISVFTKKYLEVLKKIGGE